MAQSLEPRADARLPLAELPLTAEETERAALLDFRVDREDELPVGTQLDWRLRGLIARGALRPGDRLPSVRELAGFAGVNVNTARAVYGRLAADGLLSSERGRGTFVTEAAAELAEVGALAAELADRAAERGLDPRRIAAVLHATALPPSQEPPPQPFPSLDPNLGEAALKRELRAQIGRLEREIAAYAWHDPLRPPPPRPETAIPVGRVLGVEELERTRVELIDRLRRLHSEARRRDREQEEARAYVEEMVANPAEHRWEIVTSEDLGEPGCRNWRVVPAFGPVGAIMGWWRVKVSSGCPLAAPSAAGSAPGCC